MCVCVCVYIYIYIKHMYLNPKLLIYPLHEVLQYKIK